MAFPAVPIFLLPLVRVTVEPVRLPVPSVIFPEPFAESEMLLFVPLAVMLLFPILMLPLLALVARLTVLPVTVPPRVTVLLSVRLKVPVLPVPEALSVVAPTVCEVNVSTSAGVGGQKRGCCRKHISQRSDVAASRGQAERRRAGYCAIPANISGTVGVQRNRCPADVVRA